MEIVELKILSVRAGEVVQFHAVPPGTNLTTLTVQEAVRNLTSKKTTLQQTLKTRFRTALPKAQNAYLDALIDLLMPEIPTIAQWVSKNGKGKSGLWIFTSIGSHTAQHAFDVWQRHESDLPEEYSTHHESPLVPLLTMIVAVVLILVVVVLAVRWLRNKKTKKVASTASGLGRSRSRRLRR